MLMHSKNSTFLISSKIVSPFSTGDNYDFVKNCLPFSNKGTIVEFSALLVVAVNATSFLASTHYNAHVFIVKALLCEPDHCSYLRR